MCTYIVTPLPNMGIKIQNTLDHWRSHPRFTARDLHRLLGMLTFMVTLVPRGQFCQCPIQWWASEAWCQETGSWSDFSGSDHSPSGGLVVLSCSAAWGLTECLTNRDHSLYRCIQPQLGSHKLQGTLSRQQTSQHINLLKMEAVLLSVAVSLPQHKSRVVCLMCANAVIVSYIIKEGGTKPFRLTCLTIRLLKFCNRKDIRLVPVHLPGSRNIQANALPLVGQTLLKEWVVYSSSVLLMGNTSDSSVRDFANRKLPVFASPFLNHGAKYVYAIPVLRGENGVHPPTIQNATACTQQDSRFPWSVSDFGSSAPDGSIMDARATQAVLVSSHTNGRASTSQTRSLNAQRSRQDKTLPTLKSTCMVALRDLFVKLIHSQAIADRMGTNLRASLIGCYESHWSRSIE